MTNQALSASTLKTIHTLLINIHSSMMEEPVKAGQVFADGIFDPKPYTQAEADEINTKRIDNQKAYLDIVSRLLAGEEVPEYLDSDY